MTLEAALVLPLFLSGVLLTAFLLNMLCVHRQVGMALENACRTGAAYAYAVRNAGDALSGTESLQALSAAGIQASVSAELADRPLVRSMLDGTVSCLSSQILDDGQTIDVVGRYAVKFPVFGITLPVCSFQQRARMHAWVGYCPEGGAKGAASHDGMTVYVAETGTVYHTDPNCSYLHPTVRSVPGESILHLRSLDGSRYHACELCHAPDTLSADARMYITDYGNRYHTDPHCSGLKRTVQTVLLSEVGSLHECSKCAGYGH